MISVIFCRTTHVELTVRNVRSSITDLEEGTKREKMPVKVGIIAAFT
jgi:hypothetical protein